MLAVLACLVFLGYLAAFAVIVTALWYAVFALLSIVAALGYATVFLVKCSIAAFVWLWKTLYRFDFNGGRDRD